MAQFPDKGPGCGVLQDQPPAPAGEEQIKLGSFLFLVCRHHDLFGFVNVQII